MKIYLCVYVWMRDRDLII